MTRRSADLPRRGRRRGAPVARATLGLPAGARLLLDAATAATDTVDAVLLTLVVGGSLVIAAGGGRRRHAVAAQERARTARLP